MELLDEWMWIVVSTLVVFVCWRFELKVLWESMVAV